MLKQRVLTALVLAALFLALLFLSPWYIFAGFTGIVVSMAAWEWSALAGMRASVARGAYVALITVVGVISYWWLFIDAGTPVTRTALLVACGWWAVALLWVQGYPSSAVIWSHPAMRSMMGLLVLVPAWCGLVFLRRQPDGQWLILVAVLLVACADIGAYFAGRALGRHKLAPRVSPGKTWEGLVGGLVVALIVGLVINAVWSGSSWVLVAAVIIPTALVSVVGDLLESMVKRQCGVKDSGNMLPGHGGLLDRIDGLTAAIPVFALAILLAGWSL